MCRVSQVLRDGMPEVQRTLYVSPDKANCQGVHWLIGLVLLLLLMIRENSSTPTEMTGLHDRKVEHCLTKTESDNCRKSCYMKQSSLRKSVANRTCIPVEPGFYSYEDVNVKHECMAGMYSDENTNNIDDPNHYCDFCPPGYYASDQGSTTCTPCPSGSYATGVRNRKCDACETNLYNGESATDVVLGNDGLMFCKGPSSLGDEEVVLPSNPPVLLTHPSVLGPPEEGQSRVSSPLVIGLVFASALVWW